MGDGEKRRNAADDSSNQIAIEGLLTLEYRFSLNTPKALANFSPGLERSDNPG